MTDLIFELGAIFTPGSPGPKDLHAEQKSIIIKIDFPWALPTQNFTSLHCSKENNANDVLGKQTCAGWLSFEPKERKWCSRTENIRVHKSSEKIFVDSRATNVQDGLHLQVRRNHARVSLAPLSQNTVASRV